MNSLNKEEVLSVHHWTDTLFSFKTTRHPSFRFENGQFAMIGLEVDGRPLLRAYSLACANYEDTLEFFSIKVPDGPLTSRLQHIRPGDQLLVGRKPTGTLLLQSLLPGRNLWLLATGTGLAPFLSLVKDLDVYERFERVILVHGCRLTAELAYKDFISTALPQSEMLGREIGNKLIYYPTVTREPFKNQGRITDLMRSGKIYSDLNLPRLNATDDRVMLCGSPAMLHDLREHLEALNLREGSAPAPGHFVIERAFVGR